MSKELAETTISYAWTDDKTTFMVKIEGIPTNKEAGFPMAFVAHNLFEVAHDIALSTIKDRSHLKKFSLPELLGVFKNDFGFAVGRKETVVRPHENKQS